MTAVSMLFAVCLCSAFLSALILWVLLRTGWAWRVATDTPTHRSLHSRVTPRVGGLGFTPVATLGIALVAPRLALLAFVVLALASVCLIDDRRGLSARTRFLAQILAAMLVCQVYPVPLPWWCLPIMVMALVWMTNLYNFMDGADGLAGSMALIGFAAYAAVAWPLAPALSMAALVIVGAVAGFLPFNWPAAKLFMGDAGSIPLGFLAGAFGLIGWSARVWPFWLPLMIFLPFIADATVTLAKRLRRGEKFWEAHREHYYQRMIQMDDSHTRTIRIWCLLMLLGAALAVLMARQAHVWHASSLALIAAGWCVVLIALGALVDRRWALFSHMDARQ